MSPKAKTSSTQKAKALTVGTFFTNHGTALGLELVGDSSGMEAIIEEPTINRPGLALAGFFRYFASKRVQVAGHAELSYLRSLSAAERRPDSRPSSSRPFPAWSLPGVSRCRPASWSLPPRERSPSSARRWSP